MKKTEKHYVWMNKRFDATIRMIYEGENGKHYMKFENRTIEVIYDNKKDLYIANI